MSFNQTKCFAFLAAMLFAQVVLAQSEDEKIWYSEGLSETDEVVSVTSSSSYFRASITWRFDGVNTNTYSASGRSHAEARENARNICIQSQTINEWKNFCRSTPVKEEYSEVIDCGDRWTGWKEIGQAVGNPCDEGCQRGDRLGDKFRLVGFPPRPQTSTKFRCFRVK